MGTVSEYQRPSPPGIPGYTPDIPPYTRVYPRRLTAIRLGEGRTIYFSGGGGGCAYELFFNLLSMGNVSATIPPGHTPDISLHDSVRGGPLTSEGDLYVHELFFFLTTL